MSAFNASSRALRGMAVWYEEHAGAFAGSEHPALIAMRESYLQSAKELRAKADEAEKEEKADPNIVRWCTFCRKQHPGGLTCMGHHP